MLRPRSIAAPALAPLVGSALLAALALWHVPWRQGLVRPHTLYDHSSAAAIAPAYALLRAAALGIPLGASVVVRAEPPDAALEMWYHRFAVALLPGRRAIPTALYGTFFAPEVWKDAEYLVVVGPKPSPAPGRLLFETPEGSVWLRDR
ncbi:MAG TPA: hypothetical protein VMT25_01100 [Thermoanaerobaculia bacterium]|nr:hypothetical protein [Thermoanaerobaculia bacterium]